MPSPAPCWRGRRSSLGFARLEFAWLESARRQPSQAARTPPDRPLYILLTCGFSLRLKWSGGNPPRRPPFPLPEHFPQALSVGSAQTCARQSARDFAALRNIQIAVRTRPNRAVFRNSDATRLPANDRPNRNPCRRGTTAPV